MKVKCITNQVASIPQQILKRYSPGADDFPLIEGKEYIIYGIWVYLGYIWYCMCDESYTYYPKWNISTFFKLSDNRLSRHWVFGFRKDYKGEGLIDVPCITFPEFAKDDDFYDDLVDGNGGDPNEIIFREYKELMDMEFPDSSISAFAQLGDEEWLMCPLCIDAWQSKNFQDALVRCPFCETIFNNPRYRMNNPSNKS